MTSAWIDSSPTSATGTELLFHVFLGGFRPVALAAKLQDDGVMQQPKRVRRILRITPSQASHRRLRFSSGSAQAIQPIETVNGSFWRRFFRQVRKSLSGGLTAKPSQCSANRTTHARIRLRHRLILVAPTTVRTRSSGVLR